jgi:uncharacterized protein
LKLLRQAYEDMDAGKYAEAKKMLEHLLNEDELKAALHLGWMYFEGLGVPADIDKASYYYELVAQTGDADGHYHAAHLKRLRKDISGALAGFEYAAERGNPSAAYWASAIYQGDYDFIPDPEKARMYLGKAAELGHMFAKLDLAKQQYANTSWDIAKLRLRLKRWRIK